MFDLTSATSTTFQASSAPVAIARETDHSGISMQGGRRGMCSDTLDPGGEVQICSVGCILGMPEIPPFLFIVAASRCMGFLELKKRFFNRGCLGCGGISKAERAKRPRPFFAFRAKKPLHNEARPRERSDRGRFFPIGKKAYSYRGAYRVPVFH